MTTSADPNTSVFERFVLGLFSSAMVNLGRIPDPDSGRPHVDLALARETLAYLEALREKTSGNLTASESRVLDDVLARTRDGMALAEAAFPGQ